MSDAQNESVPAATNETPDGPPSPDRPDLGAVRAKIDEAHQAEDHLVQVMPGAIDADADANTGPNIRPNTGADDESTVQTEGGAKSTDDTHDTHDTHVTADTEGAGRS